MTATPERLRLFPLQVVLFPGMELPLVVFEERYRLLVAECLEASEPFGVALIREGLEVGGPAVPHAVGCTAQIRSVQRLPDGRLQLATVGERRFRIVALHHDQPYLSASVEYPVDELTDASAVLMDRVSERYAQVVRLQQTGAGGLPTHGLDTGRAGCARRLGRSAATGTGVGHATTARNAGRAPAPRASR